jgi:hypothetical protein
MSLFGRKRKDDDERKKLELELAEAAQEKLRGTEATGADPEATQPGIAVPESDDSEVIAKIEGEGLDTTPSEEVDHEHDMEEVSEMSDISTTAKEWHGFYKERLEEKLGQRREMESRREKLREGLREMEELLAVLNKDVDEALGERYERVVIEPINQKKDELNRRMAEALEEESQQLEADIRCLSTALERLEGYVRE